MAQIQRPWITKIMAPLPNPKAWRGRPSLDLPRGQGPKKPIWVWLCSSSRGGKRGPWPASWSSPPPRSNHLWRPLTLTGPYYIRPLDALPTNWCHLAASFYLNSLLKLRSIFNTVEMNWPLLKNYFFRPKKTSENKTWMVSYPMKFLRPLLRFPVGRKFAILPLSKNSWRSHNKEANEKTFDFMRPTTLLYLNFSKH